MNGLNSFLLDSYFTLPLGSGCGKIADGLLALRLEEKYINPVKQF
jgi:hypothetical protein